MTFNLHVKLFVMKYNYVLFPPKVLLEETYMYNIVTQSQSRRSHTIVMLLTHTLKWHSMCKCNFF